MTKAIIQDANQPDGPRRAFAFLILYRWFSLIPPVITLLLADEKRIPILIFLIAVVMNVLISIFPKQLNQSLHTRPWLLVIDLGLMAALIALSGGWHSPYYLHALNPLLAAAFFFQWRGALLAATGFLPLYMGGVLTAVSRSNEPLDWLAIITDIVGFYLISGVFGYASNLVARLQTTRDDLVQAHRDLGVIHDLTLSLQSAADVEEVLERVLEAVTVNLGFKQAVVGLVDQDKEAITGWLGHAYEGEVLVTDGPLHLMQIPLSVDGGPIAEALLTQEIRRVTGPADAAGRWIHTHFGMTACRIFPMLLREHPVGILLVDATESREDPARLRSLESIASQAAVAVGTTMLCIDRAQRLAVQDERLRIAQDIHDTVSQALFGIVYTLDGSLKLLPQHPDKVIPGLERALRAAQETHDEVRQSILNIWPTEITAVSFADGLRKYTADICRADGLQLDFKINGDFERLSPQVRRGLYRIAQESLANAAHHANAGQATVSLEVMNDQARLIVLDNGCGFDPNTELAREYDREHFGLRGMQERAATLRGVCEFNSQPGAGTAIVVDIPVQGGSR
ncbi:MAG: GAF domain-containing sensor histidine kinase [Anaerolineae bacterium]